MCSACAGPEEKQERPWQWMIDELIEDIEFWVEHGFDKERPEAFAKMQRVLEKSKKRQEQDMK